MEEAEKLLPGVIWCEDTYQALEGANAVVILTEWNQFRSLNFERMRTLLKEPIMIDLRNIYDPEAMADAGFRYTSVGRPVARSNDPLVTLPAQTKSVTSGR
jgi:UDPglucose 6-dehydrogenase